MFETRNAAAETQQEFWIDARRLRKATASTFYRKLDETLDAIGFAKGVREICRPAYAEMSRGGRPGIDPAVYFKMLMIGFFGNLPSERSIASRCADSFSLRAFLGYGLEEATPDHSSPSVIRGRLRSAIYQAAFELALQGLRQHGLLKGRNLGIDSRVIEANASLRALVHRNTEEAYWEYVKRLAAEAGIDPDDTRAVRRFDKNREGRKTSNCGLSLAIPMHPSASRTIRTQSSGKCSTRPSGPWAERAARRCYESVASTSNGTSAMCLTTGNTAGQRCVAARISPSASSRRPSRTTSRC